MSAKANSKARILLIDNYDSFTYNLAHLFGSLGAHVDVLRNDDPQLEASFVEKFGGLCIGPGPGRPKAAGKSLEAIGWALAAKRPLLGVCLGLQAIGEYFGGSVVHAPSLMHGKTSQIEHDGTGVFSRLSSPFRATRYHSLCVDGDTLPQALRLTATSEDKVVQGLAHRSLEVHGVQFHPESVLTTEGHWIFRNFLDIVFNSAA
jgi:anthranilate synthase/aminodeoxychorismate synthase-like glutamine amidotransferase